MTFTEIYMTFTLSWVEIYSQLRMGQVLHLHGQFRYQVKNLIESLVERVPKRRLSIQNCLRCKWSKYGIMQMKCAFYRPRSDIWKRRRVILPVRYSKEVASAASLIFGNTNTNSGGRQNAALALPQSQGGSLPGSVGAGQSL